MSRPMWRVYEVRSNSWSSAPNTISTCSTELRLPASRLSTRLRTSRPPSWASAQWSVAPSPISAWRCWNATVPVGEVLDRRDLEARAGREMDLERAREQGLRIAAAGRIRPTASSSSTTTAAAPSPRSRIVRVRSARPAWPVCQRRTIGRLEADARRHVDDDALVPAGTGELGELVVEREGPLVAEEAPGEAVVAADQPAEAVEDDAGGARLVVEDERLDAVFDDRRHAATSDGAPVGSARAGSGARGGSGQARTPERSAVRRST